MKFIKIIVEIQEGTGMVLPVMFPNCLVHKDMAEMVEELCKKYWPKAKRINVVSAGDFDPGKDMQVGGKSTTLNLEASFEDKLHILVNDSMNIFPVG